MTSVSPHFTPRRLLAAGLLIAVVIAAIVVWMDRESPSAIALDNLSGEEVHDLIMQQQSDGDLEICGVSTISDVEAIRSVPHGLDSMSAVPAEVVEAVEAHYSVVDDHEQRHFDTHRLLLISWDPTSKDLGEGYGAELGSVYELHYLEDENSIGWGVVYSGTVYECRPEDLIE